MPVAAILIIIGLVAVVLAALFAWFRPGAVPNRTYSYHRSFILLALGVILIGVGALLPLVGH